jgi:TetR/AcrR family transcriptional regulator, regulator of cefoperazone and chloramphenicol sensitivity
MPGAARRDDSDATRAKLLEAASIVFSEMGFRAATVRDICTRAGANVASVNYHFGDKLGLYTEVLKDSSAPAIQLKIRTAMAHTPSPEDQLRIFVRGMFDKMLASDRPARHMRIIMQELANPTPALTIVVEEVIRPQYEQLCAVIAGVIGHPPKSASTRMCVHSVVGQVTHYFHTRFVMFQLWPQFKMTPAQLDEITDHIIRFTMAGLAATAASAEAKTTKGIKDERAANHRQPSNPRR